MNKSIKGIIDSYFKDKGYKLYGNCYFDIQGDYAYCVEIETPGQLSYVTCYIQPLFIPCSNRYFTYGNRLDMLAGSSFPLLRKSACDTEIKHWRDELIKMLERRVFPVFEILQSSTDIMQHVDQNRGRGQVFGYCTEIDYLRLELYHSVNLVEFGDVRNLLCKYRKVISECSYLSEKVLKKKLEECDMIAQMAVAEVNKQREWSRQTKESVTSICFNRSKGLSAS